MSSTDQWIVESYFDENTSSIRYRIIKVITTDWSTDNYFSAEDYAKELNRKGTV